MVFGKNSARPRDEVQEVVYFSAAEHEPGSTAEVSDAIGPVSARVRALAPPRTPTSLAEACLLVGAVTSALSSPFSARLRSWPQK